MIYKRRVIKHDYKINHISNPHLSVGGVITEDIPYVSGYYLDDLMEIGEAEVIFPNSWVKADSKNVLLRNLFNKYDIIQIWRDKQVVFTGLIADDMELSFSQIKVKLRSNIFLLTEQYTEVESYTEEPANSVKRFLKWWNYNFKDDFNTAEDLGSTETTTIQPSDADTFVWETAPTTNYGTNINIYIGGIVTDRRRAILKFDFSIVPAGATINLATLSLYKSDEVVATTAGRTYWTYRLTQIAWTEAGATWAHAVEDSVEWPTAGGDYTETDGASATVPAHPNWMNWIVTDQVDYALNNPAAPDPGVVHFLIKDGTDGTPIATFLSSNYTDDLTKRPKLVIEYSIEGENFTVVAGSVAIEDNKLKLEASGGVAPAVRRTTSLSDWTQDFDLKLSLAAVAGVTTITLYPNAAGSLTELTPLSGANWENVDEEPHDSDTTYNYTTASTGGFRVDTYNLPACGLAAGTQINKVTVKVVARHTVINGHQIAPIIYTGGVQYNAPRQASQTSYLEYSYAWTINPQTGLPWTVADVDALQAGVELSTWGTNVGRVTQVKVEVEAQVPVKIYCPWLDASNYLYLLIQNTQNNAAVLRKTKADATDWEVYYSQSIPADARIRITRIANEITVYVNGIPIIEKADDMSWQDQAGYLRFEGTQITGVNAYFDDVILKLKEQIISEGTINSFGSTKTTSVSYETLYNAIHQRIRTQLNSSDSLATTWEWKENPVAYVNSSTPCSNLDFKERIGSNKDVTLSVAEKNIAAARTRFSFSQFKTNLIALGAGTTAVGNEGQPVYESYDFDAYDEVGMILQTLYQLSDETDYSRLKTLADLWLGKYKDIQENIEVDPIDYEKKGFSVGDGYIVDIPELLTDSTTYYRIMSEKREFSAEGAEKITVNWKYKQRSFLREVEKLYREVVNKARYNQGTYISQNYPYQTESVAAAAKTTKNKDVRFRDGIHSGVKLIIWNVYCSDSSVAWSIWVDNTDRTSDIFGSATTAGNKNNIDLTQYMTSISDHTIEVRNDHATTAYNFAAWGDCELWVL